MSSGYEKFAARIGDLVVSVREGLKSAAKGPEPRELFVMLTKVSLYEGSARVVSDRAAAVGDIFADGESAGRRVSEIGFDSGFSISPLLCLLTRIRNESLDIVYSLEMTEDERRGVLLQVYSYLDGFVSGFIGRWIVKSNSERPAADEPAGSDDFRFFLGLRVPSAVIDRSGLIKGFNDAAARFFDVTRENVMNRPCGDVLGLPSSVLTFIVKSAGPGGEDRVFRARISRPGGETVVEVQAIAFGVGSGEIALVFFDLTEKERLTARLLEAGKNLKEMKSEVSYGC